MFLRAASSAGLIFADKIFISLRDCFAYKDCVELVLSLSQDLSDFPAHVEFWQISGQILHNLMI
jgi:hypothetical protein